MTNEFVSVVIPAFNEADRLPATLRETSTYFSAREESYELIVVDDGSTDRTSSTVRTLREQLPAIRLIRLPENRGKGYAVRTGVLNSEGSLVMFQDADGATEMSDYSRLKTAIEDGADIAIGSRAVTNDDTEVEARLYRRLMGRLFHLVVRILAVSGYRDTQCGFKLFRGGVARDLFARMQMDGFSFDVELLLMAELGGYRVDEIPVNWTHKPGSQVHLVFDSFRMVRDLVTIRANYARGRYDQPCVDVSTEGHSPDTTPQAFVLDSGRAINSDAGSKKR